VAAPATTKGVRVRYVAIDALNLSRRRALALGLGVAAITAGPGRIDRAAGQEDGADPEAVALLEAAVTAMAQVQSFRFRLTTEDGVTTILDFVELESIEGGVQRPDRFQATINASAATISVSLDVVGIGETVWVENPVSAEGGYEEFSVDSGLADLLNPDRLLLRAVGLIERPTIAGEDSVDGVAATVVEGEFRPLDALQIAGTPVATPSEDEQAEVGLVLDEPLFVQVWIDESNRVIQMAFQGRLMTLEDPGIIRVLRLFDFDQPIDIQPPV
jgi:hypothetical protein